MSITSDLKGYVDQSLATAQSGLNDVADTANEFVGKYRENVADIAETATAAFADVRTSAEKAINADALRTAVEPYLAQAREYGTNVTDRAEGFIDVLLDDPRLSKLVATANTVSELVLEQVTTYVVKPVQDLTGFGPKPAPARTAPKPAKAATTKPATRPSTESSSTTARTSTAKSSSAKSTTTKPTAKKTTKASPAKRTSAARTTSRRTTAKVGTPKN